MKKSGFIKLCKMMMKPACELALFIVGCILILAQLCPIVRQVVRVLSFVLISL